MTQIPEDIINNFPSSFVTSYLVFLNDGVGSLLVPVVVIGGTAVGVLVPEDSVHPIWSRQAICDQTGDQYSASHGEGFIYDYECECSSIDNSIICQLFI